MRQRRATAVIIAVLCAVTALVGCTRSVDGRAVSIYDDPFKVAGLPTTSGPSGPRPEVLDSELTARNGDGGEVDTLALNAVEDIQAYWAEVYPEEFEGEFEPVDKLVSWSAKAGRNDSVEFCTETTYRLVNAAYCGSTTPSAGIVRCCYRPWRKPSARCRWSWCWHTNTGTPSRPCPRSSTAKTL